MVISYVGVGESEDVQMFYYFIKSERSPKDDPLVLWITGGPGCSTLSAIMYEIGKSKHAPTRTSNHEILSN